MAKKSFKNGIDEILGVSESKKAIYKLETQIHAESRTTIVTKSVQMTKLKSIAFWDRKTLKEVIEDAFIMYITNYENQNGEIKNTEH